nr:hypothetical protein [uncultured Flavobacterium sp.]
MNRTQEKGVFQIFRDNYLDMPPGAPIFDDMPDVIFKAETGGQLELSLQNAFMTKD